MGLGSFLSSAGGGSLIGSLATGLLGRSSAKSTNRETERLSSTAHQRATKDLRMAGLNPILSATGGAGSGASTPQLRDPMESATKGASLGASSALALRRANQEIKNLEATELLTKEQKKAIKYGVPGKTLGTGAIDEVLGIDDSSSAAYALGGAASAYGASQMFKKGGKKVKAFKKAETKTKTKTKKSKGGGWDNSRLNRSGKFNRSNIFRKF